MTAGDQRRIKLTLQYDGGDFHGWQVQPGARTVQGELEEALERLTGMRLPVLGSGRTDRGVHAAGQVAAVTVPGRWSAATLRRALNAVLPGDVWVAEAAEVDEAFHPRYGAVARTYEYRVGVSEEAMSPFHRRWCWPLLRPMNSTLLAASALEVKGGHSFQAFAKAGQPERGHRCLVQVSEWRPWGKLGVRFIITADRFLHHMVRYLVGTMVDVALERRPLAELRALLADESVGLETSPPAPPHGLFLMNVSYPDPSVPNEMPVDGVKRHSGESRNPDSGYTEYSPHAG
ncbi:MAG: tRNA pseudouridine(38-40) synthase TruA, partial [Gemmatimonadetes bacterium]|nr:tRNA pseudouridine(38-40) synthase TruA [Gemmatimonadota bacterium]